MWHKNIIFHNFGINGVQTIYIPDTFKWHIIREVTLKKDCCDEEEVHYFNITKPWIPKGTTLKVKYRWCNFYGMFYRCFYNDNEYDIKASDVKEGPLCLAEFIGLLPDDHGRSYWVKSEWDPRAEHYKEIDLEKYIEDQKQYYKKKCQKYDNFDNK